jgi:hypothetical protein
MQRFEHEGVYNEARFHVGNPRAEGLMSRAAIQSP